MNIRKNYIAIALILMILIGFIAINFGKFSKDRQIIRIKGIDTKIAIEDFHITNQSVLLWGQNTLLIADKEGNIQKKIEHPEENLKAFFTNNYAFLYDEDLGRVYEYSELGELLNTMSLNGQLFSVTYENGNLIFQIHQENSQALYLLGSDGTLSQVYSSGNKILCHDIYDKQNFSIAELQLSAGGYETLLHISRKGKSYTNNYNHEVAMYVKEDNKNTVMLTNTHLYRITDKEHFVFVDVPNVSDIVVDGRDIYLLHSGILSRYNSKLEETEKKIVAANVNHMEKVSSSIYVSGPSDIGGEIGKAGEFYTRLGYSIDKIEINGLTIGALKDNEVSLYRVTTRRGEESAQTEFSPSYNGG